MLASLLQHCRSPEANQTLNSVWPSLGLVHYRYIYIFQGSCHDGITSKSCILLYWQRYGTALQQRALAKLCGVVQGMELRNFCRLRHLYLPGWPSHWASAHILVQIKMMELSFQNKGLFEMQSSDLCVLDLKCHICLATLFSLWLSLFSWSNGYKWQCRAYLC